MKSDAHKLPDAPHPPIGAALLQSSDLAPSANSIQRTFGRTDLDIGSMIRHTHHRAALQSYRI